MPLNFPYYMYRNLSNNCIPLNMGNIQHIEQTHNLLIFSSLDANPLCSVALECTFLTILTPITMQNFQFNVISYTNEFDKIVKTFKQVNIRRTSVHSAINYIQSKYKSIDGFYVELNNSWSI